jgi:PAS domain S-box-containing protein
MSTPTQSPFALESSRAPDDSRAPRRLPLILVAVAGVAFSLGLFFLVRNADQRRLAAEFARRADVPATALQREIDDHRHLLQSIDAFYFSSRDVDRREFRGFTRDALQRLSGLLALEWAPRVALAHRAAHEQAVRREGYSLYQILDLAASGQPVRAAHRAEYLPVVYAEPASQLVELGRDLGTHADFQAAMIRACDSAAPAASAPYWRRAGTNQLWTYRLFTAVYTNLVPHRTPDERRRHLAGYAVAVVDLQGLLQGAWGKLKETDTRGVAWQLFESAEDPTVAQGARLLQRSPDWEQEKRGAEDVLADLPLDVAGRHWRLRCHPTAAYMSAHGSGRRWAVLGGGLLATALLTAYLSTTLGRAARVQQLVVERTTELARSHQELQTEFLRRQRTETELATERHLIDALLDTLSDHIYFKDRASKFIRINRSMAEMFKLSSPAEAVGKTDFDYFTAEHAQRAFDDEQEILRTGRPMIGREEMETWPDGTVTWVSTTKQCLRDKDGAIIGTFGLSRDITPRKRAERRLEVQYMVARTLAEAATFNAAAPLILQEICECLGWSLGALWNVDSSAGALRCVELWHAPALDAAEFVQVSRSRTFAAGVGLPGRVWSSAEPAWIRDVVVDANFPRAPYATKAGLHSAIGFPIRAGSQVLGVIEFFSRRIEQPDDDLLRMFAAVGNQIGQFAERKRMEQELAQQAQELQRSNEELEQFAYVASHDLQEPLRMIASYTQLLERRYKDQLDADAREFISFAVDGAARMQTLINDLLAYSRVGTRARTFTPTDCNDVLRRALKNLEIAVEESAASITHTPLPTVLGDATQLTQLLQNLIGNALKFRGGKPPVIHVSAELQGEGAAPEWRLAVRDEGIGIEPQYFERIFVIFQRLHGRDEYPGTGIGLAVCKKIVERHGGRIWVESAPGQGATFHFTVPKMVGP